MDVETEVERSSEIAVSSLCILHDSGNRLLESKSDIEMM